MALIARVARVFSRFFSGFGAGRRRIPWTTLGLSFLLSGSLVFNFSSNFSVGNKDVTIFQEGLTGDEIKLARPEYWNSKIGSFNSIQIEGSTIEDSPITQIGDPQISGSSGVIIGSEINAPVIGGDGNVISGDGNIVVFGDIIQRIVNEAQTIVEISGDLSDSFNSASENTEISNLQASTQTILALAQSLEQNYECSTLNFGEPVISVGNGTKVFSSNPSGSSSSQGLIEIQPISPELRYLEPLTSLTLKIIEEVQPKNIEDPPGQSRGMDECGSGDHPYICVGNN